MDVEMHYEVMNAIFTIDGREVSAVVMFKELTSRNQQLSVAYEDAFLAGYDTREREMQIRVDNNYHDIV